MGEGGAAALADGAEDVDLALVLADLAGGGLGAAVGGAGLGLRRGGVGIDGVAHGLAVDGDGVEAPRAASKRRRARSSWSGSTRTSTSRMTYSLGTS